MVAVSPKDVICGLAMWPLPQEGGMISETARDEHFSAIAYLLESPDFSHPHCLPTVEIWFYQAGSPLSMLTIDPSGTLEERTLGPDVAAGENLQLVVPGGCWQSSKSLGVWSLVGTVMAPPYDEQTVSFADRDALVAKFSQHTNSIDIWLRQ